MEPTRGGRRPPTSRRHAPHAQLGLLKTSRTSGAQLAAQLRPRRITADDLVATKEIAERLQVGKPTVSTWQERGLMPEPLTELACGRIWSWAEVEEWAERTGRLRATRATICPVCHRRLRTGDAISRDQPPLHLECSPRGS